MNGFRNASDGVEFRERFDVRKFRRTRQVGGVKPTEMYFKAMNWIHQRICRSNHWRKRLANELLPWALDGLETPVGDSDTVILLPAMAGGSS